MIPECLVMLFELHCSNVIYTTHTISGNESNSQPNTLLEQHAHLGRNLSLPQVIAFLHHCLPLQSFPVVQIQ